MVVIDVAFAPEVPMSPRLTFAGLLLLGAGCPTSPTLDTGEVVPDFSLEDVNPTSASYGSLISPSDLQGQASAWYFGHAT